MIDCKTVDELKRMRAGGKILAEVLAMVQGKVRPGVSLNSLDALACQEIVKRGAKPSFLGYRQKSDNPPFPSTLCASVDNEVVHGPANRSRVLIEGQIVGLDLGLSYNGLYVDMAVTAPVGKISALAAHLINTAKTALMRGIEAALRGRPLSDISQAIFDVITENKFGVVTSFSGHGVGRKVHEEPPIPNYPTANAAKIILKAGMTFAIEPMVTAGDPAVEVGDDGWTVLTKDRSLAAHFEHTVAITDEGAEILTAR